MTTHQRPIQGANLGTPRGVTVAVEIITPYDAESMLLHNHNVRKVSEARVRAMANDMVAGRWEQNGETIKLDGAGNLLDGQHRLTAIVKTGRSIPMAVARNVQSAKNVDVGQARSVGQVLRAHYGIEDGNTAAAALRIIRCVNAANFTDFNQRMSPSMIHDEVGKMDKEVWAWAIEAAVGLRSRGLISGIFYCLGLVDLPAAKVFAESYRSGAGLDPSDPILKLRDTFINEKYVFSRRNRQTTTAVFIKVWNARREGRVMKAIGFRENETFPTIR